MIKQGGKLTETNQLVDTSLFALAPSIIIFFSSTVTWHARSGSGRPRRNYRVTTEISNPKKLFMDRYPYTRCYNTTVDI
jgi:hypothetical protein